MHSNVRGVSQHLQTGITTSTFLVCGTKGGGTITVLFINFLILSTQVKQHGRCSCTSDSNTSENGAFIDVEGATPHISPLPASNQLGPHSTNVVPSFVLHGDKKDDMEISNTSDMSHTARLQKHVSLTQSPFETQTFTAPKPTETTTLPSSLSRVQPLAANARYYFVAGPPGAPPIIFPPTKVFTDIQETQKSGVTILRMTQ